jgi:hypothetical protein
VERDRVAAWLSTPWLALIGISIFLPTVRSCSHDESPATMLDGPVAMCVLAPYFAAVLLLGVVAVALSFKSAVRACGGASIAIAALAAVLPLPFFERWNSGTMAWAVSAAAAIALCVVAVRARPWPRITTALGAWTFASLPLAGALLDEAVKSEALGHLVGAWTMPASVIAVGLIVLWTRSHAASKRPPTTR